MNHLLVVHGLLSLLLYVESCPEAVVSLCKCEDLYNGVQLDCSHSDGNKVIQVLRDNQALLGLVQSLTMHNAGLRHIHSRFLDGLYIKRLDLSYNQMVGIDDHAFTGMSPIVQELILAHNNLSKIPAVAFTPLSTILRLDLSNNSITDISHEDAFPSLPKLYDINLGSNNICSIHSTAFGNVKDSIRIINLGHNCLRSVPSSSIRGLKQLQALHMQKNNIAVLEALSFLNLPVLNLLNLAGNKISEINRQAFLNVPQLKYLYLTNNQITHLTPHQFASFNQIEMIDLTGNNITEIPDECMARLQQLRQLFLGGNHIHTIGKNAFANSSIVILSLINNELTEISEGMLDGMPRLQSVVFKGNKIKFVHHNAFYNTPSVIKIDLSDNEIVDLSPSTFLAQLNLQMIDLRNNKLPRTPYAALNHRVGTVFLQENPLVCTEKIHMLQDGLAVFVADSEDVICGGRSTTTPTSSSDSMSTHPPKRLNIRPAGAFQQGSLLLQERQQPHEEKSISSRVDENEHAPSPLMKNIARVGSAFEPDTHIQQFEELTQGIPKDLETTRIPILHSKEHNKSISRIRHIGQLESNTNVERYESSEVETTDEPDTVQPLPVPFLDEALTQNQAILRGSSTESSSAMTRQYTLPSTVVIMPKSGKAVIPQQFSPRSKSPSQKEQTSSESLSYPMPERGTSPTFIIVLCMTVLAVAMVAVVLGLCILRHRNTSRFSSSPSYGCATYANAYITPKGTKKNVIYDTWIAIEE